METRITLNLVFVSEDGAQMETRIALNGVIFSEDGAQMKDSSILDTINGVH